ncbi:MAG TPA: bifunctional phosphopantothenoylcysteine decarboxylase/phosphopantothenate--cysteine ligase CoaBC [Deltaproteobacteria bacterium]|nr:MAG: phosphopantothenoylcysteine decarboxylase [Deltaproteobacteria bacterium GWA2_55_82]OGQ64661.1 MAG: phosphopantothenoylcysteine decarboxylase [Deltaproteobacteria bacterium RIFCSPLOWO2_02_FULL_55_12]OIJ75062.1 MAG: phosphopantothenoylcysteine decarboxylase [Deltaproteobacteria bacterium GWC2_55_46]HBG45873.1 bifunctional phosphopantothenoylcysteine decarboxylase/phosphopantothenate--cysteine ligase CoaBC [Deltaproteobacteria bacterium]HCY09708.1 bifunctional phosphopantothenoylcysteine 
MQGGSGVVLKNKKITLGVTGAISAYKALELSRLLIKEEAEVWPVMTRSATEFITPLSLSTLCKNPVSASLFDLTEETRIGHIELAQKADLLIVAPATANFIGKAASGIADDLLTTIACASSAPVLIAPSMNSRMWGNPVVQENLRRLEASGYLFVGPEEGELACGYEGKGRLASVENILEAAREALSPRDLKGEKVLVTAGPTREAIDPVRFVSNSSSGRMGYAIAKAARRRGAEVVLVSGPSYLPRPAGITYIPVTTAEEMLDASVRYFTQSTVVVMAAAVADYRPTKSYPTKVKKEAKFLSIEMERTPDVLKYMGSHKKEGQLLVGFALETDSLEENARKKLKEKELDLVVGNTPAGLDSDFNQVTMIDRDGKKEVLPAMRKDEVADRILDRAARLKK